MLDYILSNSEIIHKDNFSKINNSEIGFESF